MRGSKDVPHDKYAWNRRALLTKEPDEEAVAAIQDAEPSERSRALDYLMDDPRST